ncbi:hypothetical protein FOL47_010202, partial [Perkinsus chesapeaki]
ISIAADVIKKCEAVTVGGAPAKLLGAAYDPTSQKRTLMVSSSKDPVACSAVAEAPEDMDLLGEYHITTTCSSKNVIIKCTDPGAAVKMAHLWGSYTNQEIQVSKELLSKCAGSSGTTSLTYEVSEDGKWEGTTRSWVAGDKGLTCTTPVPDLKFIGNSISISASCGSETVKLSCGGLEGIKETLRIVARWGENPNPKILINQDIVDHCKTVTNIGDGTIESAWLRVSGDGSTIQRYLWSGEAVQCDYGVKSPLILSDDSVKVKTQCDGQKAEGSVAISCDNGFDAVREFARNWGGWDSPVMLLDPSLYSSCSAMRAGQKSDMEKISAITYNVENRFRSIVFPDKATETCVAPSSPPSLFVNTEEDAAYNLKLPCNRKNYVDISCTLPGNAVDVSTFFGLRTREVIVPEVEKCKSKTGGMSPLRASIRINTDGTTGARSLTWPASWKPAVTTGVSLEGDDLVPPKASSLLERQRNSQEVRREIINSEDDDPVYRAWHFWVELEFNATATECKNDQCIAFDHLNCGDVATTLFVSKWWVGKSDARVRIDDPIMEHCGGPIGASRIVAQRELPYDAGNPLECDAVTKPIMMSGQGGYVVTADCGPNREKVTRVRCDGLEWAQLFAHGWGDKEKSGIGLPADVIESCKEAEIGAQSAELTGAYYDETSRHLTFASMKDPLECAAVTDAPEDIDLEQEFHVKIDCGGKDAVVLKCQDPGSAVRVAHQWGKYPKQEVQVSTELLLECERPGGEPLLDLTYDVSVDGTWQGTTRRWGDDVCETPVPDFIFRGDNIHMTVGCSGGGGAKQELSCGGLGEIGPMLRIAARWGEHPNPKIMIDSTVVGECKDVRNLKGAALVEAWITADMNGEVTSRYLMTSDMYRCDYGIKDPLIMAKDAIMMRTKCDGVEGDVMIECNDDGDSSDEFAKNWGGYNASAVLSLDPSKFDTCKVKRDGKEDYEDITAVLFDRVHKAKMLQFGDGTSEVCKSTADTPPVLVVNKGATTAIYRFVLDCFKEATVDCMEPGDAVDVNTFMGFPTREIAVPEVTKCKNRNGMSPLTATIEIEIDGTEGLRYLTWPSDYTTEEPEIEVPTSSPSPRRPGFVSSERANYGGFRNSGDRDSSTATAAPRPTRPVPTASSPTVPVPTSPVPTANGQSGRRHVGWPGFRTTIKTSIRAPGYPHPSGGGYYPNVNVRTSVSHGPARPYERGDRHHHDRFGRDTTKISRVFDRPPEDDRNRNAETIPSLPAFDQLPSFLEMGVTTSEPVRVPNLRKPVREMDHDPVYRDWFFWIDVDYVIENCPAGEDCSIAEHLDCGGVESTLHVAIWWGGKKDARVRIDDPIMKHCGGPLGASRVVNQRELPLDASNPLSCAPVTTPIINAGEKDHIVVAYCGSEFKERHEIHCDGSIWAQHLAYGWGDSDNSGLDISHDLVKACQKVTVQRIDNLHTLLSASLKGATFKPGNKNDNYMTKRELKLTFQVTPYRYEPSVFDYQCERVITAVEIPEDAGAPAVATVRALCDFDETSKAFVKLECPESAAVSFAIQWGGFSKRTVGLGPEIMSHSTRVLRGSSDLGPAIAATMEQDRSKYYLQMKDTPGYFICDKADATIQQTKELEFALTVPCPSHFIDSSTQPNREPKLTVYFDDPYAAVGFLVRWGRVVNAKVDSYYASKFTKPAPQMTVQNSLPVIHVNDHTCNCPARAPVVYAPQGEARVTFSSNPLIAVRYDDRMVAMAASMIAGHRLSEIILDSAITHHVTHITIGANVYMGKEEEHPLKRVALLIAGDSNTVEDHVIEVLRPDLVAGPLEAFDVRRYHPVAYKCGRHSLVAVDGLVLKVKCQEGELPACPHHHAIHLANPAALEPVEVTLTFDDIAALTQFVAFWKDSAHDTPVDVGTLPGRPTVMNSANRPRETRLSTAAHQDGSRILTEQTTNGNNTPTSVQRLSASEGDDDDDDDISVAGRGDGSGLIGVDNKASKRSGIRHHSVRHLITNANKYRMRAAVALSE